MKHFVRLSVFIALVFIMFFCYRYYISYPKDRNVTSGHKNINHLPSSIDVDKGKTGKIPVFNPPTDEEKRDFYMSHDEKAFTTLMDSYFYEKVYGEGLVYAIIAANRFDIPRGNSYVYLFLTNFGTCKELDIRTEQIAMHYIRRGMSMKDKDSESIMKNMKQDNAQDKMGNVVTGKRNILHSRRDAANGILEIKKQVLNGNVKYYEALKDSFNKTPYPEEFLFYSIVMANRFDYVPANYDVYRGLIDSYSKNKLGHMDDETRKLAMSFLEYGAKKGDKRAIIELNIVKPN